MSKLTVNALVSGGRATAGPPLGPALGPTGINIGKVIAEINSKTKDFEGVDVPVKVIVDTAAKEFEIEVGTPPVSALIKRELKIEKGAGNREAPAGNIPLESVVKIAKMKKDSFNTSLRNAVKQVLGTCLSMGVTCNGKKANEVIQEIDKGVHDALFKP
ncbi:MAG: 50S ribosomal protein L11 [Candidatus Micrarchaeia archaeon]